MVELIRQALQIQAEFERLHVEFKNSGVDEIEWKRVVEACRKKQKTTIYSFEELMCMYLNDIRVWGKINFSSWIFE